jgi:hypothetical protein
MGLARLNTSDQIELCRAINSFSTIYNWMVSEPYITDDSDFLQYLPSTNANLGFAVVPIMIEDESELIIHLKQRFGSDPNIMSFLNTQESLAKDKGSELKVDWTLRVFKETKLFGTTYKVQSNLMPEYGNTGITIGAYHGKTASAPINDMFLDMR